jgi:hypothetical protein
MSSRTVYTCDKCGKEQKERLTTIRVELDPYTEYKSQRFEKVYLTHEYCDDCAEKLGFMVKKTVNEKVVVEPTTAEKLYELVAQIVYENSSS